MSVQYKLDAEDGGKILKVVIYSGIAAGIASLIAIIPEVEVPIAWMWLVPIVNTALVAVKKFFENR